MIIRMCDRNKVALVVCFVLNEGVRKFGVVKKMCKIWYTTLDMERKLYERGVVSKVIHGAENRDVSALLSYKFDVMETKCPCANGPG